MKTSKPVDKAMLQACNIAPVYEESPASEVMSMAQEETERLYDDDVLQMDTEDIFDITQILGYNPFNNEE